MFTLGSEDVDDMCFDDDDNLPMLNRLGIVKLLSTIKKQSSDFNWMKIKKDVVTITNNTY